jgi:hypothetical protein
VEGALQETLIAGVFLKRKIREDSRCIPQEEDQRRQQAYSSRGRSEKIPQGEDQRRQQAYSSRGRSEKTAGVFLKRKIREDSRRIVFLKRKIREDSRHIPQLKKNNDQQALFGLRSAWFAVCECLC